MGEFSAPSWRELNGILWHEYVLYAIVGTGILFTVWSGFCQYRALTHGPAVSYAACYDDPNDPGAINHFQALSAALSATVGLGNIGGVALAIALGGPGAIFWMWVDRLPRHGDQAHRGHDVDDVSQHRRPGESARRPDVGRLESTRAEEPGHGSAAPSASSCSA